MPSPFQVVAKAFDEQKYFPKPKMLVSGLTRGGTLYCANFLNLIGVRASHESIWGTGGVQHPDREHGRIPTCEVSGLSALWAPLVYTAGIPIVHLVRHPVHCCASNVEFWARDKRPVTWAEVTEVYLQWHRILDKYAQLTIHLERWEDEWYQLLLPLGLAKPDPEDLKRAMLAYRGTSSKSTKYTWDDLPRPLQKWSEEHGYGRGGVEQSGSTPKGEAEEAPGRDS